MLKNIDTSKDVDQGCKQQYRNGRIKGAIALVFLVSCTTFILGVVVDSLVNFNGDSLITKIFLSGFIVSMIFFFFMALIPLVYVFYNLGFFPFHRAYLTYSGDELYVGRGRGSIAVTKADIVTGDYVAHNTTKKEVFLPHHSIKLRDGKVIKTVGANWKRRDELMRFFHPTGQGTHKKDWFSKIKSHKQKPSKPTPSGRKIK